MIWDTSILQHMTFFSVSIVIRQTKRMGFSVSSVFPRFSSLGCAGFSALSPVKRKAVGVNLRF